jgi:endonuclease/exonuclease/phosphatase family metal-dependent hydrolase
MSTNIRIATFNCENLFGRAEIFNESPDKASKLLGYVSELQKELTKDVFDHNKIKDLESKLKGYAIINDMHGKGHEEAKGSGEWRGTVELVRDNFDDVTVDNVARVISDIDADLICLCEVESRPNLKRFHDAILLKKFLKPTGRPGYDYIVLFDGNDDRGIDVAIMSRLPISWIRSHVQDKSEYNGKMVSTFSRDCLEAQVQMPNGITLFLMLNHFKSMGSCPKNDPKCNRKRELQAKRVEELASEHDLQKEYIIVAGDLNSEPTSPSLLPLINNKGLYNVNLELPVGERGTYGTGNEQLDYLFVSNAIKEHLKAVRIERRGVFSKKWPHYETVTNRVNEASDHSAVVAEFEI